MKIPTLTPADLAKLRAAGIIKPSAQPAIGNKLRRPTKFPKVEPGPMAPPTPAPVPAPAPTPKTLAFIVAPRVPDFAKPVRYHDGRPCVAERARLNLCVHCCAPAIYYGPLAGYGASCPKCCEQKSAAQRKRRLVAATLKL